MSDPTASLRDRTGILDLALVQWASRGTEPDKAAARRAGSTAVDAIDALLRDLFLLRGRLVREIRQADDAARSKLPERAMARIGYPRGCTFSGQHSERLPSARRRQVAAEADGPTRHQRQRGKGRTSPAFGPGGGPRRQARYERSLPKCGGQSR